MDLIKKNKEEMRVMLLNIKKASTKKNKRKTLVAEMGEMTRIFMSETT